MVEQASIECSSPQRWLHLGQLQQNFCVCPMRKQRLHCTGERILELTSNSIFNSDIFLGNFGAKNLSSTLRVCTIFTSFFIEICLNASTGTGNHRHSQNSSSKTEMSSFTTP